MWDSRLGDRLRHKDTGNVAWPTSPGRVKKWGDLLYISADRDGGFCFCVGVEESWLRPAWIVEEENDIPPQVERRDRRGKKNNYTQIARSIKDHYEAKCHAHLESHGRPTPVSAAFRNDIAGLDALSDGGRALAQWEKDDILLRFALNGNEAAVDLLISWGADPLWGSLIADPPRWDRVPLFAAATRGSNMVNLMLENCRFPFFGFERHFKSRPMETPRLWLDVPEREAQEIGSKDERARAQAAWILTMLSEHIDDYAPEMSKQAIRDMILEWINED